MCDCSDVRVLCVLTFKPTIPGVWESARVYCDPSDALDAQTELHDFALREHGILLESVVQAAPVFPCVDPEYPEGFDTDPTSPGYTG